MAQTQGAADYEAFIASPEGIINQSVAQAAQNNPTFETDVFGNPIFNIDWSVGGEAMTAGTNAQQANVTAANNAMEKNFASQVTSGNVPVETLISPEMKAAIQQSIDTGQPMPPELQQQFTALNESMGARAFDGNPYGAWNVPQGGTNAGYEAANELRRTSTAENATVVRTVLAQMFPNATVAQMDAAAQAALRANQGATEGHYTEVHNPVDIITGIAQQLGGVPQQFQSSLDAMRPQFDQRIEQITAARNGSEDAADQLPMAVKLIAAAVGAMVLGPALGAAFSSGTTVGTAAAMGGNFLGSAIMSAATGGDWVRDGLLSAVAAGVNNYVNSPTTAPTGNEYAFSDGASAGTNAVNADIAGAAGVAGTDAVAATDVAGGMEEFGNSTGIPAGAGTPVVFDAAGNVVENAASVAAENSGKSFLTQLGETAEGFANRFGDNFMKQFMKNGVFDTKKFLITLGKPVVMQLANGGSLDLQSIAENMFFSATGNALGATFANDLKATGFGQTIGNTASNTIGAAGAGAVVGALSGNDPVNSAIYSGVATGTTGLINNAIGTSTNEMVNTAGSIVAGAAGNAAGAVASGSNASFGSIFLDGAVSGAVNATINHLFPDTPSGNQIGNSASTDTPNAADATLTGGGVSTDTAINMGDGIDDATAEEIAATGQGGNNTPANAESYQTANYDQTVATAGDTGLINQATETIDDATQAEIDATGQGGGNSPGNVTDYQNDANYDQTVTTTAGGTTTGSTTTTTGGAPGGGTIIVGGAGSDTGGTTTTSPDAFGAPSFGSLFYGYKDLTKDRNIDWSSKRTGG